MSDAQCDVPAVANFVALDARDRVAASRLLLDWLSDDASRAALYQDMIRQKAVIRFLSCADRNAAAIRTSLPEFHQDAYLLVCPDHLRAAWTNKDGAFSNAPFRELGSGGFMLALDPGDVHDQQRAFAVALLTDPKDTLPYLPALCSVAFKAGALLALKQRSFDLAQVAEQIALRYVGFLFGFAQADHPLLEASMRAAYRGLSYQMMARHFAFEPETVLQANAGMAALAKRVAALIGLYRRPIGQAQRDESERLERELAKLHALDLPTGSPNRPLAAFTPIIRRLAGHAQNAYSETELAIIVTGLVAGAIGNIQAGICAAVNAFFRKDGSQRTRMLDDAVAAWSDNPELAHPSVFDRHVWEALRLNPPASFLPRQAARAVVLPGARIFPQESPSVIPPNAILVLGVGGASLDASSCPHVDISREIFGGAIHPAQGMPQMVHSCLGQDVSMALISFAARQVILLAGLAESLDPRTGRPLGLQKLWGYNCISYPLEYQRMALLRHSCLNVVMRVKKPVSEHAEALKLVIASGAPQIEKLLKDSRHIHFAWFNFQNADTELALHTIYDRDFDSYIQHFALEAGELFDLIFAHIENAPPMPVRNFPHEFVNTIRIFNQAPEGGYLFSAYPKTEANSIVAHFSQLNLYDFKQK